MKPMIKKLLLAPTQASLSITFALKSGATALRAGENRGSLYPDNAHVMPPLVIEDRIGHAAMAITTDAC